MRLCGGTTSPCVSLHYIKTEGGSVVIRLQLLDLSKNGRQIKWAESIGR